MAKKKNFWYVLVLANGGPTFVTAVNHSNKTAHWNKSEAPLEMEMFWAKDLALGLMLNFHMAYVVCSPIEIKEQPYRYEKGHFEWQWDEESPEEEKDGDK